MRKTVQVNKVTNYIIDTEDYDEDVALSTDEQLVNIIIDGIKNGEDFILYGEKLISVKVKILR